MTLTRQDGRALRFLVTGGAGFIGSAVVRHLIAETSYEVAVIDKLTYAGNEASLASISGSSRYRFFRGDVADPSRMRDLLNTVRPDVVLHLAAESHVDRSIDAAGDFITTNIVGTYVLLDAALEYWRTLSATEKSGFRFHHVSTDEVFGSLGPSGSFDETSAYRPSSPYSASKASSDHLVRAWHATHELPVVISNCSNNYGPYQLPEKLIPLTILNSLEGHALPVYGDGRNVRDWLFVQDHVKALVAVAERGRVGETYLIGSETGLSNIDVVRAICNAVDACVPDSQSAPRADLIEFVEDRPGHDRRYAVNTSKIREELGWRPTTPFDSGLLQTVEWYLENRAWWAPLRNRVTAGERLGKLHKVSSR